MTIADLLGCGSKTNIRPRDEFFETPFECTLAFMKAEYKYLPLNIWEPFCGNGALGKVLMNGHPVYFSDLNHRDLSFCGQVTHISRVDFLMERKTPLEGIEGIVSNPPFNLAHQIIVHALDIIKIPYLALFLKADFLNSQKSSKIFKEFRPARIYALSWRPDFKRQGSPTMNCSWYIWDGKPEKTEFNVLDR